MPFRDIFTFKKPTTGQKTKAQTGAYPVNYLGFGTPEPANYQTYRTMRNNATVSIGFAFSSGLIINPKWNYIGKPNAPTGAVDYIAEMMTPLKDYLVEQAVYAIQYGWQGFEKVFDVIDGSIQLVKLKPLLQDKTQILIDKNSGSFAGLLADREHGIFTSANEGTVLPPEKAFVFTNEPNPFDGLYGRPRFEAIRDTWSRYNQMTQRLGQWLDTISSVLFILYYPESGGVKDRFGNEVDAFEGAQNLLQNLRSGMAIAAPGGLHPIAEDWAAKGITDPKILRAWNLEMLETASNHGLEFVELQKHHEALMLRGLLVPERSLIEGQTGTKAEAESHASIALLIAQQTLEQLVRQTNWYIINQALALKYGNEAVGTVEIQPEPVDASKKALISEILRMLFSPQSADLTLSLLDIDKLLDNAGLPKASTGLMQNFAEIIAPYQSQSNEDTELNETGQTGEARPDDQRE